MHQRTVPELIRTAKALQVKAEQAQEKSEQFYVSLGLTLAELKERKPKGTTWPKFLEKHHFDYGQERADELIRIGAGTTTVEKTRERKKASMEKLRAKSAPRGTGKMAIGSNTSVERSAAIRAVRKTEMALNDQVNVLARELHGFVDDWEDRVKTLWSEHQFKLEKDGGKDCFMQCMETSAMQLWRLAQALDGR